MIVAERRTRLLKLAVAPKNLLEGWVSVKKSVWSDFTRTTSSESSEESRALKKLPSLMIEGGRFLLVATEYHATPEFVVNSKTRSDSQSFVWLPVIALTKDSFLTSQWSLLEQKSIALSSDFRNRRADSRQVEVFDSLRCSL